jgi:hypothetical protein
LEWDQSEQAQEDKGDVQHEGDVMFFIYISKHNSSKLLASENILSANYEDFEK